MLSTFLSTNLSFLNYQTIPEFVNTTEVFQFCIRPPHAMHPNNTRTHLVKSATHSINFYKSSQIYLENSLCRIGLWSYLVCREFCSGNIWIDCTVSVLEYAWGQLAHVYVSVRARERCERKVGESKIYYRNINKYRTNVYITINQNCIYIQPS